jgi:hypothetical protein
MPFASGVVLSLSSDSRFCIAWVSFNVVELQTSLNGNVLCLSTGVWSMNVNDFEYALYLQLRTDILQSMIANVLVKWRTEVGAVFRDIQYQESVRDLCRLTELLVCLLNVILPNSSHSPCSSSGEETWRETESGSSSVEREQFLTWLHQLETFFQGCLLFRLSP